MLVTERDFRPLPDIFYGIGNNVFDVNSHSVLTKNKTQIVELSSDHIPSYKAIEIYLKNKGISLSDKRNKNEILVNNLTGILVEKEKHQKYSMTFGQNNIYKINKEKRYDYDAKNMLKATLRDLSYFALHLDLNEQKKYLENSKVLINRNFYLCLYE